MRRALILGFLGMTSLASAQTSAPDSLSPGVWAEKFSLEMTKSDGQPVSAVPPEVSSETACYTPQDTADPKRILMAGAEEACTISHFVMKDGKIDLAVNCAFTPETKFSGDLTGTYSPTTFELKGSLRNQGTMPVVVNASMSARRVGACKH